MEDCEPDGINEARQLADPPTRNEETRNFWVGLLMGFDETQKETEKKTSTKDGRRDVRTTWQKSENGVARRN